MKRLYFLYLSYLFILAGCHLEKGKEYPSTVPIKQLKAEKIVLDQVFHPMFLHLHNRHLLVATTSEDNALLHLFSTPTLKYIGSQGAKGYGPDDFQVYPLFCRSHSNYLYIWGYTPFEIRKIQIDPNGCFEPLDAYELTQDDSFNQMHILHDSILIYNAIPYRLEIKKYDLKKQLLLGTISFQPDAHKESYFYSNRGTVAAKDSFILYSYIYKRKIDIYSTHDLTLRKSIQWNYQEQKIDIQNPDNNIQYYMHIVAGEKYFYALYNGHAPKENNVDGYLEVYDYNGKPVARYQFDITPFLFDIDEENNYIYGYNPLHEDYLLKYKI